MKFIIVYLTDAGDLYTETFKSREQADKWIEENEWKAVLIEVDGKAKIEDHT